MKGNDFKRVFMIFLIILLSNTLIIAFNNDYDQNNPDSTVHELTPIAADSYWDPYITILTGDNPTDIFVGDADNDGDNDMVTANWGDNTISIILWNETTGEWDASINKVAGSMMYSIFIDDANNDGDNDIVAAGYGNEDLYIFLWNSTSEDWDAPISKSALDNPYAVAMGDVDNDGDIDIVSAGDSISIFLWNTTAGDWETTINKSLGASSRGISIGDANNDGDNDIVVDSNGITIFLWNSTSEDWDAPSTFSSTGAWGVVIGDADNDGDNDIAASIRGVGELDIILWNETAGTWDPAITRSTGGLPRCVFIGDINNNGFNDIVTANGFGDNSISIFLWNTTSEDWDSPITKATPSGPSGVFIDDANNDGYNDIASANYGGNNVSIFLGISPNSTILYPIIPNVDVDGIINLNWSDVFVASIYYVYRDTSEITTVENLTPIAAISESNYTDTINSNGLYYYGIIAGNDKGNSSISNCESVTVAIPVIAPTLNIITPHFDEDGVIFLNWTDVLTATTYYVYRDSQKIESVDDLTPIAIVTDSNFTDIITSNGYYFYAIVAENNLGNSSISNWDVVIVSVSQPGKDYLLEIVIIIGSFLIAAAIVTNGILRFKKKNQSTEKSSTKPKRKPVSKKPEK